jgi:type II secretory pathway pseudopilin PulG
MMVVVTLIGILAAVALPQLMPAIAFSRLEGASRHVAGYGRSAMAYAVLMRRPIIVTVDLDKQEYWTIERPGASRSMFEEDGEESHQDARSSGDTKRTSREKSARSASTSSDVLNLMGRSDAQGEADLQQNADVMRERFEQFVRMRLEARAKQVKKEGILSEIGPLFDKPFKLDEKEEEGKECTDPLLTRTALPEGVRIESVRVGATDYAGGQAEIEVSPVGLNEPVAFYLVSEDGDYFTVTWDPITGGVRLDKGKQVFDGTMGASAVR